MGIPRDSPYKTLSMHVAYIRMTNYMAFLSKPIYGYAHIVSIRGKCENFYIDVIRDKIWCVLSANGLEFV